MKIVIIFVCCIVAVAILYRVSIIIYCHCDYRRNIPYEKGDFRVIRIEKKKYQVVNYAEFEDYGEFDKLSQAKKRIKELMRDK